MKTCTKTWIEFLGEGEEVRMRGWGVEIELVPHPWVDVA